MHQVSFTFDVEDAYNRSDAALAAYRMLLDAVEAGKVIASVKDPAGLAMDVEVNRDDALSILKAQMVRT